ncbi:MAG TPA: shikimate dehydrogenase [Oculatellaceae cyanobacterium]
MSSDTPAYALGLVGHPVAKSLSPPMHKAALEHCQLKGDYTLFDISEEDFESEIERLKEGGISGFNVTIPHKTRILKYCSSCSPRVTRVGAANTIKVSANGSMYADNTDIAGFANALDTAFGDRDKKSVCVLGAGGAAKAALEALSERGYEKIFVLARSKEKAVKLCQQWRQANNDGSAIVPRAVDFSELKAVSNANLYVSTIPYGQTVELDTELLSCLLPSGGLAEAAVFDMVYSRDGSQTALVKFAGQRGIEAVDGTSMLVHQAKEAFTIWTGKVVPYATMHDALVAARSSAAVLLLLLVLCTVTAQSKAFAATPAEAFEQYQRQATDLEHQGKKKEALQAVQSARKNLTSFAPYSEQISELRVREAALELQTNMVKESLANCHAIVQDRQKIIDGAKGGEDLWLDMAYLKDLLGKYAQDNDSQEAFELAHKLCNSFHQTRCKARETIQPLCDYFIRHKKWKELEPAANESLSLSSNPLTQMSSLAMLQLSLEKQGKKKEAQTAEKKINQLDPKTPQNERVWHRDMANMHISVRNYDRALNEIGQACQRDQKLTGASKSIELANDLGIKADIENKLGKFEDALDDAKEADQLWSHCGPNIWRSREAIMLSKCHTQALTAWEYALRSLHRDKEADQVKAHKRTIEYVR